MGDAGRRKALTYSWEAITKQVEDYYNELLKQYPDPSFHHTAIH
jgi:glycosyltransferase involved in cell wall biosynthesis